MFKIVHDDEQFIVINKLDDISFHKKDEQPGLFQLVEKKVGCKLYPVHRLDKVTTGLVILARNAKTAELLNQQFRERKVEKYYLAISAKKPLKKQGKVIGDMAKSRNGTWKLLHSRNNPAITQFFSMSIGNRKRLFIVKPHTGKTHQIRVALKSIGAPILGDPLYSSIDDNIHRCHLHAYSIGFSLGADAYRFECMPEMNFFGSSQMQEIVQFCNAPWDREWPNF